MATLKNPRWEPLPRKVGGRGVAANKMALKLAARKGKWAIIGVYPERHLADQRASRIRTGKFKGFNMVGRFAVEVRQTAEGWCLYAKCIAHSAAYTKNLDKNDPRNWVIDPDTIEEDE